MDAHPHATPPANRSSDRAFGWVFAAVCAIVALYPILKGHAWRPGWMAGAALFALVALFRPALLAPLNRLWYRLGLALHAVVNPVVMALIFVVAVVPTGLLMRVFGKDPLRLRRDPKAASYWIRRTPPGPEPDSLKNQF